MAQAIRLERNEAIAIDYSTFEPEITEEVSKIGLGIITIMAGLTGIWGAFCLFGGLIEANGIRELSQGWLTAITGG
jgi:hypothetical protein